MGSSKFNAGGNPTMDWHPTQGGGAGVDILLVASRISSCLSSWLVCRPLSFNANDLKESSAIF